MLGRLLFNGGFHVGKLPIAKSLVALPPESKLAPCLG